MNTAMLIEKCIIVALPLFLVCLCLALPFLLIFNFFHGIYRSIYSENLKGKVVVITGASSGIGEQLAYEYARNGAYLVIVARRETKLLEVAQLARQLGSLDVLPVFADVTNIDDCKRFIDETINRFGKLDHLVNNAGICGVSTLENLTDVRNFAPVMDVNFWGSIYPTHYAIPYLKKTRGKIVVTSSSAAWLHPPLLSFYAASKAAIFSFYETLRVELAPAVTITTTSLGLVDSEMTQGKLLNKDGILQLNRQLANEMIQGLPLMNTRACAEAIVSAVRRGDRYLTEPKWIKLLFLMKTLFPQLVERYYRSRSRRFNKQRRGFSKANASAAHDISSRKIRD